MAESYLGRLQSMFSDPTANRAAPRPVSGPMTPMQRAWSAGSPLATNLGLASQNMPRPVTGPLTPLQQQAITRPNFQTVGGPQQVGGEMRNFRPAAPNFTMPGPSYPSPATMSYPTPTTAGPSGLAAQGGGGAARFMGAATDVTPRLPAPAVAPSAPAAGGGMMRGLLGTAGRAMMSPLSLATTAATMLPWGDMANGMRNAQQGVNDFLGIGQGAPAPMPTPEMAMNAAPPPMSMAMAPSMVQQIPTPQMQAPAPIPAPQMQAPAPMPMPMPAPAPAPAPMPAYTPPGGVWEGQNQGIGDDTRARAMAWLALQRGM